MRMLFFKQRKEKSVVTNERAQRSIKESKASERMSMIFILRKNIFIFCLTNVKYDV